MCECAHAPLCHPQARPEKQPILPMRPTAWMAAGILHFGTGQHAPDGATAQAKPPHAQASGNAARVPMRRRHARPLIREETLAKLPEEQLLAGTRVPA